MTNIKVTQNDADYDLSFTLQDATGAPVDITGATIKFKAQKTNTTTLKFNGNMSVVSGTEGKCKYTVQSTDFSEAGKYAGEIEVTFTSGQIITYSGITITVDPELPKS